MFWHKSVRTYCALARRVELLTAPQDLPALIQTGAIPFFNPTLQSTPCIRFHSLIRRAAQLTPLWNTLERRTIDISDAVIERFAHGIQPDTMIGERPWQRVIDTRLLAASIGGSVEVQGHVRAVELCDIRIGRRVVMTMNGFGSMERGMEIVIQADVGIDSIEHFAIIMNGNPVHPDMRHWYQRKHYWRLERSAGQNWKLVDTLKNINDS